MATITDIEAASLIQQYGIETSEVSDDQWTVTTTLGNGSTLIQHRNPAEYTGYEYDGDLSAVRPTDVPTEPAPAEGEPAPAEGEPAPAEGEPAPAEGEPPLDPAAPTA